MFYTAGIEIHKLLIKLFKYLDKKYQLSLNVIDEGNYWETDDEEVLKEQFRIYNSLIENFALAIESTSIHNSETLEEYLIRIAEIAKK